MQRHGCVPNSSRVFSEGIQSAKNSEMTGCSACSDLALRMVSTLLQSDGSHPTCVKFTAVQRIQEDPPNYLGGIQVGFVTAMTYWLSHG